MTWLLSTYLICSWVVHLGVAQIVNISPFLDPPDGTSLVVDPSFAGFGIEPSNLFSFTGRESPNVLTGNLLQNLVDYTGYPANVRIGGNTQDYMVYSDSQLEWAWIDNPVTSEANDYASNHMLIGPHFYDAIDRLPENTPITYGINMAYQANDYAEVMSTLLTQAVQRLSNVLLTSFELGNEPDLWLQNGFRTGEWSGEIYTQQWLDRADILCRTVLVPRNISCNVFEPGATASTVGTDFQIQDLVSFGISNQSSTSDVPYVARWNQHDYYYFVGVSSYELTMSIFMQLSTTRDQFCAWEEQILQAEATPYRYALREMGIVGPIGLEGITDTFGAALWTLNFFLYAATLNITSVGMHMTDNSNASAWQPIEMYGRQPFVRPLYYAFVAFDQIIGPSCQAQVAALDVGQLPGDYIDHVEAYAIYQDSKLSSIVVINTRIVNESDSEQPTLAMNVSLPAEVANQNLYVAYLTSAGVDATSGTTWNGLSFEQNGDGTPSKIADKGQTVQVGSDGTVLISLRDSEALVAQLGIAVGDIRPNRDVCEQLKGSNSKQNTQSSTSSANSIAGRGGKDGHTSATSIWTSMRLNLTVSILSVLVVGLCGAW